METDVDLIVSEHQIRRRICFKEIVTPHKTRHPQSLTNLIFSCNFLFVLCNFSFPSLFCICEQVCNYLKTYSKGKEKNKIEGRSSQLKKKGDLKKKEKNENFLSLKEVQEKKF